MIQCVLSPTISLHFPHPLAPFYPPRFRLLADARACTHWSTHAHKIHSLEKPSQQFGPGVQQMSCPIETERRVLCAAENAATASRTKKKEGGGTDRKLLVRTKIATMSFHQKCINSHLDEADYIHFLRTFLFFLFNRSHSSSHYHS